ncbi:MAG: 2,3-bisphosphoglycerate-independent phosphoglycerate mutase [Flavobacteriales bacterium]|nr:2,3-bisphosphoglycerate-independent phosphoglycerate mutase [Flavobacteriales bacterium]
MNSQKKVALLILDGWGYGKKDHSDAIFHANTPVFDSLINDYPNATLLTDGEHVGLPEGQMGNSEVGHLNIGAGRVVFQDLVKINKAVEDNSIAENTVILDAFRYAKENHKKIHFLGLVSDGGIHSHQQHLVKLCHLANKYGIQQSFIHAFTDGRDTDPKSGKRYLETLKNDISSTPTQIASVIGRYYAMDRDLRWERIKIAYDLMVRGIGTPSNNILNSIQDSYHEGVSDEFIKPLVAIDSENNPIAVIDKDDVVICFNYRTDRCREITRALHQEDLKEHGMLKLPLHYVTMTNYDDRFENVSVIFRKDNLQNTLGEIISNNNLKQIRIAETEKYPHVTFFFSGGREAPFKGETRLMANSPKVATYDLQPEMSAEEIKDKISKEIANKSADFICLNFANPDMVGHTGVFDAIKKAVEKVDTCTGEIVDLGKKHGYSFIIIADHGNADYAINTDGSPNTAHTTNPVPIILIDKNIKNIRSGKLADIAPTILKMMNLNTPSEMNGKVLI